MSNIKQKYIKKLYNKEKENLNFEDRLKLLDLWIKSCEKFEEFEMSETLYNIKKKEKENLNFLKKKKNIFMIYKIIIDKIKNIFK